MRIILSLLIGFGLTLPLLAQDPQRNFSDLKIQVEGGVLAREASTNREITVQSEFGEAESAEPIMSLEKSPQNQLIIVSDEKITEPDLVRGEFEETGSVTSNSVNSKASFLVDTGIQYADEGEYAEAERAYLRALEAAPGNSVIRFRLSTLYIMMGRYTEAVPMLEALVEEFPENSQTRNNLAWCYATGAGVKDKKKALLHAREAILSSPLSPSMWNTLAEAYYMAGDYDKALRSSEHAIDLLIQTDQNQTGMASFQAQHQKIQRAQQAFKRFEGLDDEK